VNHTPFEVSLRQQEMLREAQHRRWVASIRRKEQRTSRIAQALGLRPR
jgi:hypothetical protein